MFTSILLQNLGTEAVAAVCFLVLIAACYCYVYAPTLTVLNVPSIDGVESPYGKDFCKAIEEGTAKFRDSVFKLNTSNHETVVLPAKYIGELKAMPESSLSLGMELYERQLGRHTLIGTVGRAHGFVNSIRLDLNQNLTATLDTLLAEVEYAVQSSLGSCPDWKPVPVYPQALRMVALLTARTFVGLPLSRSEDWIDCSVQTTVDTFTAAFKLWTVHWALRPLMALTMPETWSVRRQNRRAAKLIKPTLARRVEGLEDLTFKPPIDMMQFFLKNLPGSDKPFYHAELQSAINVAAIHTTSMAVTHVLYDLAAHPDHIEPLRLEIEQTFASTGGVVNKNTLARLHKMDSFLRESQRVNPPGVVSMSRKVQSDIILSDGVKIPKGSLVACDSWSATRDPNLWDDPEVFDGFRFEKLRSIPGNETKYQFVTSSPTNMPFGHGSHSCPGRFFVAYELKILFSHILLNYDVQLMPNCRRPHSTFNNIMILPDMASQIMFKSRSK